MAQLDRRNWGMANATGKYWFIGQVIFCSSGRVQQGLAFRNIVVGEYTWALSASLRRPEKCSCGKFAQSLRVPP